MQFGFTRQTFIEGEKEYMTANLRPRNLGEILDSTFQIYRSKLFAFTGIAAIPVLTIELIQFVDSTWLHVRSFVQPGLTKSGLIFWNFVVGLGFYHISTLLGLLLFPAFINLTSTSIFDESVSFCSSLHFAFIRWARYFWIAILKMLAVLVIPELLAVGLLISEALIAIATGMQKGPKGFEAVLVFLVPVFTGIILFLWLGACFSLSFPAAALEQLKGVRALRRSWALTKGTRTRIWFIWLAIYVSMWVLTWGLEFLLGKLMYFIGIELHIADAMRNLYGPAVYVLVTAIYILLFPIFPITLTLIYYDQRIRREGYDVEKMMESAGLTAPATLPVEGNPITPGTEEEVQA
jgi:hypothetical protein